MHTRTHAHTQTRTRARALTYTHTNTHTHTHTHTPVVYQGNQGNETEEKVFQGRFKRADRGRITDRNRGLVPDNWSLVRERTLHGHWTLFGGCYSNTRVSVEERSCREGVSVKVKKFSNVDGDLVRNDLKAKQRQLVFDPLPNR